MTQNHAQRSADQPTRATRTYAGIGSRNTPVHIQTKMEDLAEALVAHGYILRSGGAAGADSAFERGCDRAQGTKQIFIPWNGFKPRPDTPDIRRTTNERGVLMPAHPVEAEEISARFWPQSHVRWSSLKSSTRALMSRNTCQILGPTLELPAQFVLFWKPTDGRTSGTGHALRIAGAYEVQCVRVAARTQVSEFAEWAASL